MVVFASLFNSAQLFLPLAGCFLKLSFPLGEVFSLDPKLAGEVIFLVPFGLLSQSFLVHLGPESFKLCVFELNLLLENGNLMSVLLLLGRHLHLE